MKFSLKFQLVAAIILPLVIGAAIAVALSYRVAFFVESYDSLLREEIAEELLARRMEVAFKTQVQEWKDVLLRGHDPEDFREYWEGFLKKERRVAVMVEALTQSADLELGRMAGQIAMAHAKIGRTYRQALEIFKASGGRDPYHADQAVRGIDRPFTTEIEKIVGHIHANVEAQSAGLAEILVFERTLLAVAILLGFVFAGGTLFVFLRRIQAVEQDAREAHRLETIGRVAGGVAHHYNNLLMIILGNAEFLSPLHPPGTPEHETVQEIRKAALRGGELARGLLTYASRNLMRMGDVDLNGLARNLEGTLSQTMGPAVSLHFELEKGLWMIRTDSQQLEQAILEIAANARDAMPDGGEFTVRTGNFGEKEIQAARYPDVRSGDYVRLELVDNGKGISPEIKERIFEPFFTTKEPGQGSGLGLSTVYGLVRQSGGFVLASSEPDKETSITAFFPRANGAKAGK